MSSLLKISIIIPTYNRPCDLRKCIDSILKQTVKPQEIIVVDDGTLEAPPLKKECEKKEIHYVYHRKQTPGLTASRNFGVRLAKGDIIFFLDDDVVLFPNYIEEISKVYEYYPKADLGGVGGIIANTKPLKFVHRLWRVYDIIFFISGVREGKVLKSGFATNFGSTGFPIRQIREVDFLQGGVCSFRKEIFREFLFSEKYRGYGKGEDKDFSYRVSRKYLLLINPNARLYHYESPLMRYDRKQKGREFILGRYRFFKDHLHKEPWDWIFFYWASFGYFFKRVAIMLLFTFDPGERALVKGIINGFRDILTHKVSW